MGDDVHVAPCVVKCIVRGAITDVALVLICLVIAGSNASGVVLVVICFVTVWQRLSIETYFDKA